MTTGFKMCICLVSSANCIPSVHNVFVARSFGMVGRGCEPNCTYMTDLCRCAHQTNDDGGGAEAEEPAAPAPEYAPKKQMRSEDPEFQHQQKER